jgi:hypothetical protein
LHQLHLQAPWHDAMQVAAEACTEDSQLLMRGSRLPLLC